MNSIQAAKAYASVAGIKPDQGQVVKGPKELSGGGDFGDILTSAMNNVSEAGKVSEAKTAELVSGQTDIVNLVTAVAETEVAVQTLVTLRDRAITAYQDILNMPI